MAELKPTQSKTKKVMTDLINKSKDKFNTNIDENDENIRIRTDEISQNALTGLFLVLKKGQWHGFPLQMQLVWILCIVMGSGIQWITLLLLYLYTSDQEVDPLSEDKGGQAVAALSVMTSTLILFIYVLAEFRRAGMTLYQYWGVFINEISADLSWNNLLYVFTLIFLIGKIGILGTVTILSTMSINQQNNISDQLGIALSYFFLLEVDEWIYQALVEDFDVLEEDDFFLTSKEIVKADSDEEFQRKKAKHGIYWTVLLAILTIWSGGVWYWYASTADDE
eukprot:300021_1